MNLLHRTNLLKKLASFVGVAGVASLLSTPGLAQINSRANIANQSFSNGFELAQNGSNTPSGGSNTPSNTNTPSGGSNTPRNTNTPSGGSNTPSNTNTQSSLSSRDRNFINQAAQVGMLEVQLGQLATQRGSTNTVKQYGQRMVNEHTQANQQLMQLAAQKGVTPPTNLDSQHKAVMNRISNLSGANFDDAYMKEMIDSHNQAIALFQAQSQQGQDPDLKAWATKLVPNLQAHLQMANQMAAQNRR
jgi:putative membrane protein